MECTKSGEDAEGEDRNQGVVHLKQWMSSLSERKKGKESILCIHGIRNTTGGEGLSGQDPQKCENNFPPCQAKGIIYERLCLGVRYLEMVVLQECKTEEGKSDLYFACGDGCIYSASDLLEEVAIFLLGNKRERVVLSFLLRGGGDAQGGHHEDGDKEDDQKEDDDNNEDENDDNATQLLDLYMYLYLRREIKHEERDQKYRVLYFLNERERLLNLGKYQFDIDHFAIRNWVFNNMSLLLPSKIVHSGGEEEEEKSPDEGETSPREGEASLCPPRQQWRVCPEDEEKAGNALNALTPLCMDPQRENTTLLSLPQQHHMSLFRLNSMQNEQVPILSSKICLKRKLPNILITTQGLHDLADSEERDSLLPSETSYRRSNTRRYCIEWERDHHSDGTLYSVDTYDANLNWSGKFIGSNNLPLMEYVIDVPREHKLVSSPFTFLNKKLVPLCQEGEWLIREYARGVDTNNSYYVIKTGRDRLRKRTVERFLAHLADQFSADRGPCWICILTKDFSIRDVSDVICLNFFSSGEGVNSVQHSAK
ncbi:hypothetical protein C922_00034 [Plasmodium inui San Antonio 1]|uniref:Uncharacterized protein n=1 Tax=Plasmodium inui San Antonio 1 TaxID=1237626 RepID=W7AUT8_9APIC|nr:hypothetical protein C922_00034 [Plasmodium inui San Antonio 1]EUD69171.1 hypothetical protein C922_00034 [Plasmodium inui San Antonio 1]